MKKTRSKTPNYKRIFMDIIRLKYPHKEKTCKSLLNKQELQTLDIIKLNQAIFGIKNKESFAFNQSHRSYNKKTINEILNYQKKNKLNN